MTDASHLARAADRAGPENNRQFSRRWEPEAPPVVGFDLAQEPYQAPAPGQRCRWGYDKAKTLDAYTVIVEGLYSIQVLLERLLSRPGMDLGR